MAYEKQTFIDNETTLTAAHLQHIEQGIIDNEEALKNKQPKGNYLTEEDLQTATDNALAQAKASGAFDGEDGGDGEDGQDGSDGVGIRSIVRTAGNGSAGTTDTYTITLTDNSTYTFTVYNGTDGNDGVSPTISTSKSNGVTTVSITDKNGIKTFKINDGTSVKVSSITETEIDGKVLSNTITFSDGTSFTVNNGEDGQDGEDYVLTDADKAEIVADAVEKLTADGIPEYWNTHLDEKIATIKALQDSGGKDCFSFVVMADMHYPSNLGKNSPKLAKRIIDETGAKYVLVLGDVRTRGVRGTKADCEIEWADVFEMLSPISENMLLTQGNHDAGYGSGDYDGDGDNDNYAYEFTPAEMFERVYRKAQKAGDIHYDNSGTAYYIDDVSNKVRYIVLNTQLNFDGNTGYSSYETVDGMAKYPSMVKFRYTQCQYDFLIEDALATIPTDEWSVIIGSHVPINQTGEMPEFTVMVGVLDAYNNKTTYSGSYAGTTEGGVAYTNKAEPLPNNTTDTAKWVNGYRFSSSGISAQSGTTISNTIPCANGDVIRIKGVTLREGTDRILVVGDAFGNTAVSYFNNGYVVGGTEYLVYNGVVDGVYSFTVKNANVTGFRFAMPTPTDASAVIITVNEEIVEGAVGGYDAVSVNADFTSAKGNLISYHGGHNHKDTASTACYQGGALSFPIITTRCDAQEEGDSTLRAEKVADTTTEQSFDVFTVNKAERKIYATKIGAGSDREISY